MNVTLDLTGSSRLTQQLHKVGASLADATPLMAFWQKTLTEGNRRGVLAGLDWKGEPMPAVTYRPIGTVAKVTKAQKHTRGVFRGYGTFASGLHNNLTSAEYRRLDGPPLAPRGASSRVITNYMTDWAKLREGYWQVTYWWEQVVSTRGVSFLRFHFAGDGLPQRDLRGIRPDDKVKCREAARNWVIDAIRSA